MNSLSVSIYNNSQHQKEEKCQNINRPITMLLDIYIYEKKKGSVKIETESKYMYLIINAFASNKYDRLLFSNQKAIEDPL